MPRTTREKARITGHLKQTLEKRKIQRVLTRVKIHPPKLLPHEAKGSAMREALCRVPVSTATVLNSK